jgi:hypothetical protein
MRIAMCVPSHGSWHADMAVSYADIARTTKHEVLMLSQIGSQITHQRNELVKRALELNADYMFWMDSDISAPATALDELMSAHRAIVGCIYCSKIPPHPMVGTLVEGKGRMREALMLGGGMMLVNTNVYRNLKWPWYFEVPHVAKEIIQSEDVSFCFKAREYGYHVWCDIDLSQRIAHIGQHAFIAKFPEGY